jgi:hypothetical protein
LSSLAAAGNITRRRKLDFQQVQSTASGSSPQTLKSPQSIAEIGDVAEFIIGEIAIQSNE